MNGALLEQITEEELLYALSVFQKRKSMAPDGLTV